jgi:hypothetical protein
MHCAASCRMYVSMHMYVLYVCLCLSYGYTHIYRKVIRSIRSPCQGNARSLEHVLWQCGC